MIFYAVQKAVILNQKEIDMQVYYNSGMCVFTYECLMKW